MQFKNSHPHGGTSCDRPSFIRKKKLLACQTSLVAIDHVVFANYRFYHINHPFSTEKAGFFYQVC